MLILMQLHIAYFHAKFLLVITHGKHLQIKEQDK